MPRCFRSIGLIAVVSIGVVIGCTPRTPGAVPALATTTAPSLAAVAPAVEAATATAAGPSQTPAPPASPIVPSATWLTTPTVPSPTSPASPAPPSQTAGPATFTPSPVPPIITRFTADRDVIPPGATLNLSWELEGGATAEFSAEYFPVGSTDVLRDRHAVPLSGTLAVKMPDVAVRQADFVLEVTTADNVSSNRLLFVHSPCSLHYFFSFPTSWDFSEYDNCPDQGPTTIQAVEQDFEHGRMIWLAADPAAGRTSLIALLPGEGQGADDKWLSSCFQADDWKPGDPESDPSITPPAGFYQPVRGFGKLWRDSQRDQLGWALAPEQPYTTQFQVGDAVWSPYNDSYFYFGTADQRIAVIHCVRLAFYWQLVPQ